METSTRSVAAFFSNHQAAEQAKLEVVKSGVSGNAVTISDGRGTVTGNAAAASREGTGVIATLKNAFAQDDHSYADEMRRDGFVLTAHVAEAQYDEVVRIVGKEGKITDGV